MKAQAFLVGLVVALASQFAAFAQEGGQANVISYGSKDDSGIEASAISYRRADDHQHRDIESSGGVDDGIAALDEVPAPVALSAHNCIPRTDARGVSLAYTFVESGVADCVSFVSPPPPTPRPPGRPSRGPRPSPEALAASAYERVVRLAPGPDLDVSPARVGLTGLPSYFWVGEQLTPVTATAGVRGLTVTAEARPAEYKWDFGDGTTRTTRHGGRPWTSTRKGNVGHLYETKGRYEPSVTVVWQARWRVNGGSWRDLGYFSTAGSVEYPVREMVAMLVRRR